MKKLTRRTVVAAGLLTGLSFPLSGCSLFGSSGAKETPEAKLAPKKTVVPTVTPTPNVGKARSAPNLEGRLIFSKEGTLWVWEGGPRQLTRGGREIQPRWSLDGGKIVFVERAEGWSDILSMNRDGSDQKRLTQYATRNIGAQNWAFYPTWSPDGKQILFCAEVVTYDLALWLMNADGGGKRQITQLSDFQGGVSRPDWSPTGADIAFTAFYSGKQQLYAMNLRSGQLKRLTTLEFGAYDPIYSPDGAKIAYVSRQKDASEIWVMDADGQNSTRITRGGQARGLSWAPSGEGIAYLSPGGKGFDLWYLKLQTRSQSELYSDEKHRLTQDASLDPDSGLSWVK